MQIQLYSAHLSLFCFRKIFLKLVLSQHSYHHSSSARSRLNMHIPLPRSHFLLSKYDRQLDRGWRNFTVKETAAEILQHLYNKLKIWVNLISERFHRLLRPSASQWLYNTYLMFQFFKKYWHLISSHLLLMSSFPHPSCPSHPNEHPFKDILRGLTTTQAVRDYRSHIKQLKLF